MTPDPHIALAAVNISIDASLRIAELLTSRPVDTEVIAEAAQIAHEADVKVRALLPTPARGPAPSTAPTDRRLQVLARLVDVAGAAVGLEDFVASTRAEYPDVFADLDEHLALIRAGIAAAEAGPADEDGWPVQHTELCRSRGALTIAESWRCRCSGELAEYHIPGGRVDAPNGQGVGLDEPADPAIPADILDTGDFGAVRLGGILDEPLDPSLWAQTLDRAQVAALAGERPSLAVQTEPREAGWLRDLVEPAPPSEAERIAAHVAAVAPGYRERARAWLDAEHTDMVEDLAALMATVSAECCS